MNVRCGRTQGIGRVSEYTRYSVRSKRFYEEQQQVQLRRRWKVDDSEYEGEGEGEGRGHSGPEMFL